MSNPETLNVPDRPNGILRSIADFVRDRRGLAAVEFAMVAPLMMSLYFVTMEITQGIETNKKVGRIGSTVADLITQQQTITKSNLDAIMKIGGAVLQPYRRSNAKVVITAIQISSGSTPTATVAWSRKMEEGNFTSDSASGSSATVPPALNVAGSFLIKVDSYLNYKPVITWTADQKTSLGLLGAFSNIDMQETYYLRPRMSSAISCTDC